MRRVVYRRVRGRIQLEPAVAVGVRTGEGKIRAGRRMQDVRLVHRRGRPASLEIQLYAQLLDRREHCAQLGRSLLVALQLGEAVLTRGRGTARPEPHVGPFNVGSLGPAGASCNGVVLSAEPLGRAVRRRCFCAWRAFLLSSFCFLAW